MRMGDGARYALAIRKKGKEWQESLSNIERCGKVVVVLVHSACIG